MAMATGLKQIKTPVGDYGRYYDAVYETLKNGAPQLVTKEQALTNIEIFRSRFFLTQVKYLSLEETKSLFK